jgi:hypothetical protein
MIVGFVLQTSGEGTKSSALQRDPSKVQTHRSCQEDIGSSIASTAIRKLQKRIESAHNFAARRVG